MSDEQFSHLAHQVHRLVTEHNDLRSTLGDIIATLRLNWDRGVLTVPEEAKPKFISLLDKWEQEYKSCTSFK